MSDRERRVRAIAYPLWEEEGFPDGQAERHWLVAESMLDGEDDERKQTEGEPPGEAAETPTESAPAKRRKTASNG